MAKSSKLPLAIKLRKQGLSIKAIAKSLGISKSTASIWCRNVLLTEAQKTLLFKNAVRAGLLGRLKGAEMNRKKKEDRIEFHKNNGLSEIGNMSLRDLLIAGAALYWAEGSKSGSFSFVNSDPVMVKFMLKWFHEVMGMKKEDFRLRIFINQIHEYRIEKILFFWCKFLKIPRAQFHKTIFLKHKQKKVYENHNSYYGTLTIRAKKSTELKYKILGLINALKKPFTPI